MSELTNASRREFLRSSGAAGGAFVLSFFLPGFARAMADDAAVGGKFAPNAHIRIGQDNIVTVIVGRSEMGQGVLTSLPQIVAEELDADWSRVRWEQSPAHPDYNRPGTPIMITGGSFSVRSSWETLRKAGATARAMLVAAAAEQWGVDPWTLRTESSTVVSPNGKRLRYGALAQRAMRIPVPSEVKLKDPRSFTIVGQPVKRLDTPEKVRGEARFGIDVQLPGMLTAVVVRAPAFGAQVLGINADKAKASPGVKSVIAISFGVAVVADSYWNARKAAELVEAQWGEGTLVGRSSAELQATMEQAAQLEGVVARKEGDVGAVVPAKTITAQYHLPYLAHAAMEPMNCTAWVKPDEVEVWVGTQAQTAIQQNAAAITGVTAEQVKVHTTFLGGGFGRRAAQDFVNAAVEISKAVGAPVKVVYSREDDTKGAYYRPISYTEMIGGLDETGKPVMIKGKLVVPSLAESTGFRRLIRADGIDRVAVEGLGDMPYDIDNLQIDWVKHDFGIPIWFWRSVGATHNTFVTETFIDELAHAAGEDPYRFRRKLLAKHPRHLGVLDLAAEKAGWGAPLPAGVGRGIAVVECFGGWTAEVAEVSVVDGRPKVHRVVCAVDCGTVVNPQQVEAQMQSAIIYALSAALYEQITFDNGQVVQGNFDDYPVVRMLDAPSIEVYLVKSSENPGGVGEPGTPTAAPAVANALFAVTGKRVRNLPMSLHDFSKA